MATRRNAYVHGSAAPKIDIQRRLQEETPVRRLSNEARRNREKAERMNLGYVTFLMAALILTSVVVIRYVNLQTNNINMVKQISAMESQLNQMKLQNDEEYSRIMSTVDLEVVRKVAIEELGMQYAQEGQVVKIEDSKGDYVHQYRQMP